MASIDQIEKAIETHRTWKARLGDAIQSGNCDRPVEEIRADNLCELGQWLHGPALKAVDRATTQFVNVKAQHAAFHQAAARVCELAMAGKTWEAEKLMADAGEFAQRSRQLVQALQDWKIVSRI